MNTRLVVVHAESSALSTPLHVHRLHTTLLCRVCVCVCNSTASHSSRCNGSVSQLACQSQSQQHRPPFAPLRAHSSTLTTRTQCFAHRTASQLSYTYIPK